MKDRDYEERICDVLQYEAGYAAALNKIPGLRAMVVGFRNPAHRDREMEESHVARRVIGMQHHIGLAAVYTYQHGGSPWHSTHYVDSTVTG